MTRQKMIILGSILTVTLLITGLSFWFGLRSLAPSEPETIPVPTDIQTPTPDISPTEELLPTDSPTPTKKPSPTPTRTPTQTPTATLTPTPSTTPTPTPAPYSSAVLYGGYSGTCAPDKTYQFTGKITAASAGTVMYRWVHNVGPEGLWKTLVFNTATTLDAEPDSWTVNGASFPGWAKIQIQTPDISSNQAEFSHTCP